jgi:hypothetical protein
LFVIKYLTLLGNSLSVCFFQKFNGRACFSNYRIIQPLEFIDFYSYKLDGIIAEAASLYASGLTLREVGRLLNVSKSSVRKTLLQQGIVLRPPNGVEQKKIPKSKRAYVGVTPYGYARLHGTLVVDPKEIVIVRQILKLRQSGKTLWAIAHHLNDQGYKNRSGTPWEHSLVRNIITRHKDGLAEVENQIRLSIESKGKNP